MSRFDVHPQSLRSQVTDLKRAAEKINGQQKIVGDARTALGNMRGMEGAADALDVVLQNLQNMENRVNGSADVLATIITHYDITEQNILGQGESTLGNGTSYWSERGYKLLWGGTTWLGFERSILNRDEESVTWSDFDVTSQIKAEKLNDRIKDRLKEEGHSSKKNWDKNGIYDCGDGSVIKKKVDQNGNPVKGADGNPLYEKTDKDGKVTELTQDDLDKEAAFLERKQTLAEYKIIGGSIGGSIFCEKVSIGDSGTIEATVGKAEAHGSIRAGLHVIGNDGTEKFSPGISAEVGTSVTAMEVAWDQQWLGDKNLGVSTDTKVTIGKAEAKMGGQALIYGDDGKLNLQLNANASVEAIAWKAEGTAKLNVIGGDIGVKGSVQFGIGAHADVGFHDGKFKFDVGASLGIGASVGFEVDIGGMVDSVKDSAKSAWDSVVGGWNSIFGH